jgi:uncharacterized SAM-binding protein YcdF (DUF218 family)
MLPFQLKKMISQFLMPMPLVCECLLLGWILYRFTRYKKTGTFFTLVSLVLFLLFGYGFGRTYLYNLERRYPAFDPTLQQCEVLRGTPIVVLGQGMPEKSDLPVRYQNNPVFERRLLEGVRVAKLIPDSHLIVSMAGDASERVKKAALDDYMQQLNFPTNRVFMFTTARDTSEEAKLAKQILATDHGSPLTTHHSLILATSASHIPRSITIFQKQGFAPIAAPCDFTQLGDTQAKKEWFRLPFPSGRNFEYATTAVYEWFGGYYERLTRK